MINDEDILKEMVDQSVDQSLKTMLNLKETSSVEICKEDIENVPESFEDPDND